MRIHLLMLLPALVLTGGCQGGASDDGIPLVSADITTYPIPVADAFNLDNDDQYTYGVTFERTSLY